MKTRLFLTFDKMAIQTPILSLLTSQFGLVFNIFGALVNDTTQFVAIEVEGAEVQVLAAVEFLYQRGVKVEMPDLPPPPPSR